MEKLKKDLQDLLDVQCSHGNWNYDPYMQGMANGMILAMSLITKDDPKFLDPPDKWICEKENSKDYFVEHIKAHLKDGEEVICKICGKTAKEISTLRGQSGITNQNGEPMEIVEVPVSSNSNVVSVKVDASTLREKE